MKRLRLPASIPHAQLPSRAGTAPALWSFALVEARGPLHEPGTWSAGCPDRRWERRSTGSPKFLGIPDVHLPCSQTPAGSMPPSQYSGSTWPPDLWRRRLLATWPYFEAQWHGFCTRCLRFVPPLLTTTQDSLPAGG